MTSADQLGRALSMVPYLLGHNGVPVREVARTYAITEKQVLDDLEVLYMCGLPGLLPDDMIEINMDAAREGGVIHLRNADYLTRPLRFTTGEVLALILALRHLRELAGGEELASVDTALRKLEEAAGDRAAVTGQAAVEITSTTEEFRDLIMRGIREHRRLDLTYDVASRAETTRRMVDPYRVFSLDGYAYLEAWCYLAEDMRSFRLDRIADVTVTDEPITAREVALRDLAVGWFADAGDAPRVTLSLAPGSQWVVEYYPVETTTEPTPDGHLVVTLRVGDPAWLRSLLLRLADGVRVLEPADAGTSATEAAEEALDQYAALFGADQFGSGTGTGIRPAGG
ncbi:MAG: helix-turn-helix transcriptional regulator [Propionibacteriaceae bacterium]